MFQVEKRDGTIAEFQMKKITDAIGKAFGAKDMQFSDDMLQMLALRVTADFQSKIKDGKISVEAIQDSVENVLIQCGYAEVPAHVISRNVESLCPSFVLLGEAAIVIFLLQGVRQHPIHSVEAVTVDDVLRTVREDIVMVMVSDGSFYGPGAVTVFSVAVSPILHLVVGNGVLQ